MYKIDKLLKQNQVLFHTRDLGKIWNITNKNTLYTTIKRYVQKGVLIPIFKGLYATVELSSIDPILLGTKAIHQYCYISTETVLAREGIIFQQSPVMTFVSSVSRSFSIGSNHYLIRQLNDRYLFNAVGVTSVNSISQANTYRALADLL